MKLRHYVAIAIGLLGGFAFATSALDSTPLQSDIVIESRYQGARNQLALDPSLIIYYDGGLVGAIAVNPALQSNVTGQDAGFNNVTLNTLTATSINTFTGQDAGFHNVQVDQLISTGVVQATASAGSGAFTATQGLFSASTASLGFYGGNGATFGTAGQSTAALQAIFPTIPQEGFDTTRGVFAQNDGDGGWQAVCTQTNNYCNFGLDGGFNNLTAGGQNVLDNHAAVQWSSECGMDAGTTGVLTVAFGTAFASAPICVCAHMDTTNTNPCTIDHTTVPTSALARFNVASGGSDKISYCCFGPK